MIIAILVVLGLALGSFVNALVWRVRQQEVLLDGKQRPSSKRLKELSITKGRSMCPHCNHALAAKDLVPVLSWLWLRGKCRYCHKSIAVEYPLVELATAILFVLSYLWWPRAIEGGEVLMFSLWLALLTGLIALLVYDLHWFLLPNRIVYPLGILAGFWACLAASQANDPGRAIVNTLLAVLVGGGIFYVLFQVSNGKWIGGGDVKLGWVLGLIVATPSKALLLIFVAAVLGSLVSVPLVAFKRLKRNSVIPFGPFLIVGAIIAQFFGEQLIDWYSRLLLLG